MSKIRVLLVDDDPEVRDLLMDQIFNPKRFDVQEAADGAQGIEAATKFQPDLVYADLVMPGLTGKDLLIGLKSKGYQGPVIVGVKRGSEQSAIEIFRFGATDYIAKPIREAEMMSVVQRALADIQLRKERDRLLQQLQASNQQLENRIHQLTILQTLGQTLTSIQNLDSMFDAVLSGAIDVTKADHATLILLDESSDQLILRAGRNMTLVMQEKLGEPIRDELARLVMTSQEPVNVQGDGLKRFKISRDILATIYAPMVVNGKSIGVLTVGNHRKRTVFDDSLASVVNALGDYAAIGIANARLFAWLERRAADVQSQLQKVSESLAPPLGQFSQQLDAIAKQSKMNDSIKQQLQQMSRQSLQMQQFVTNLKGG